MFKYKCAVIVCALLFIGGCNPYEGGMGMLRKGSVVGPDPTDFNNYVNDVNDNMNFPKWVGKQKAAAEAAALIKSKKIFTLATDVKAERLVTDDCYNLVRILEGEHRDEEVWTSEFIETKPIKR